MTDPYLAERNLIAAECAGLHAEVETLLEANAELRERLTEVEADRDRLAWLIGEAVLVLEKADEDVPPSRNT